MEQLLLHLGWWLVESCQTLQSLVERINLGHVLGVFRRVVFILLQFELFVHFVTFGLIPSVIGILVVIVLGDCHNAREKDSLTILLKHDTNCQE